MKTAEAAQAAKGIYANIDDLLPAVYAKFKRAKAMQLSSYGLTQPQIAILLLVDRDGPMKVSAIAQQLSMVDSNVSNICTRLEQMGYIRRNRLKENQRVVEITLTPAAEEKVGQIKAATGKFHRRLKHSWSMEEIVSIEKGLTTLDSLLDIVLETGEQATG